MSSIICKSISFGVHCYTLHAFTNEREKILQTCKIWAEPFTREAGLERVGRNARERELEPQPLERQRLKSHGGHELEHCSRSSHRERAAS